ncbi:MAG: hypothetical protein AB1351_05170, partial [Thermoproteota archaeon]
DEYAPAEAFLSPLTNAPYNVTDDGEGRTIATNTNNNSDLQTEAVVAATLMIAGVWFFHVYRIWKKS